MSVRSIRLRRWLSATACGLGLVGGLFAQPPAPAAPPKKDKDDKVPVLAAPQPLPIPTPTYYSLHECLAIAMANRPGIKAAQASLASSQASYRALHNLPGYAELLSRDLPFRRQQATRGLAVAQADILKLQTETTYDVTYTYYGYVYAKQQEQTATDVIEQMKVFYEIAKGLVEGGGANANDLNQFTLYTIEDAMAYVRRQRVEAQTGQPQALAALKEAMGVDQSCGVVPKDTELPVMQGQITQDLTVSLALSNRAEMMMVAAGVDAFRLEVCAQDAVQYRLTVPTLASGSDLHSRLIPYPIRNGEYRPGAIAPEMPVSLTGKREDRVARAVALSQRQDEVYSGTRNLIQLDAVNAYLAFQSTTERLAIAKERFERGKKIRDLSKELASTSKKYDQIVRNEAQYAQSLSEYLTANFEHIKALARLDRVTGGSLKPAFPTK